MALTNNQLDELRQFDVPTVANAMERMGFRPWTEGFSLPPLKNIIGGPDPLTGYAVTASIEARVKPSDKDKSRLKDWYKAVAASPRPSIAVIQDLDPTPIGSFWGEVQATTHMALGCKGVVTDGGIRDLKEIDEIGFSCWATDILVSHAYVHVAQVGGPVNICGLSVRTGQLLHADRHGVIQIPDEIAPHLADECREIISAEQIILKPLKEICAKGKEIEVDKLIELREEMARKRNG